MCSRRLRAEAIIHSLDSSRIVYHHASGNLGSMHTSNFYANFAPVQEMSDWFEHWSTQGVKPLFTCEYSVPDAVGLGDVPRLVSRPAGVWQRHGPVGVLRGGMERSILR